VDANKLANLGNLGEMDKFIEWKIQITKTDSNGRS
jgi:hypothetical protein